MVKRCHFIFFPTRVILYVSIPVIHCHLRKELLLLMLKLSSDLLKKYPWSIRLRAKNKPKEMNSETFTKKNVNMNI